MILSSLCFPARLPGQTEYEETLLEETYQADASEILERLQQFRENPINLNTVRQKILEMLPVINSLLANAIIRERKENGLFKSATDFRKRMKVSRSEWQRLKPYFTIRGGPVTKKRVHLRWRHLVKYPAASGFKNEAYPGSPWKGYQRLIYTRDQNLRMGFLLEKDAGEKSWYDHVAGFLETKIGNAGKFTIGNFRIESGQGLVLWGPYGFGKGGDPISPVNKRSRNIVGCSSSDENSLLTGGAWQKTCGSWESILFISGSYLDATLHEDGTVKSFSETGYHRTESELEKQNRVKETLAGGRLSFSQSWGTIGITGWWNRYSRKINPKNPEKAFLNFTGTHNSVLGIDFNLHIRRWNICGEIAQSESGGWACLINTITKLGRWTIAASIRYYDPLYQNRHSHSFGTSKVQNETGEYFGIKGRVTRTTRLSLFYDVFRKPWRTYFIPVPTRGNDLFLQLDQKITAILNFSIRTRFRQNEQMGEGVLPSGQETDLLQNRNHHQYRCETRLEPFKWIQLRTRLVMVTVHHPENQGRVFTLDNRERGFLFYQNLRWDIIKWLTIYLRWTYFNTPSYDSRIYVFENDLPGVLSIRPQYGRSTRWFFLLRAKPFRNSQISLKVSRMVRYGVSSLGSGNDEMEGNSEYILSIQADVKF
ncbi:ComEA family DNA-binding protein [bacterium]